MSQTDEAFVSPKHCKAEVNFLSLWAELILGAFAKRATNMITNVLLTEALRVINGRRDPDLTSNARVFKQRKYAPYRRRNIDILIFKHYGFQL